MIPEIYFVVISLALFAMGVAGITASRHFLIMILSIEIILVAASLLATVFFYFNSGGGIMLLLFLVWSIAAAEAIALVAFYRYMARFEFSLDVSKLSKYRE
jgi:NADH-quinone oxidoreductase subunit K